MMRLTTLTTVLATLIAAFALAASATAGEKPAHCIPERCSSQAPDELLTLRQDSDTDEAEGEQEGEGEDAGRGEEEEEQTGASLQRGNRMEFDARLVRGERAGSGAVFLFQRVPRPLPSMVDKRSSFLGNSVDEILGARWKKKFDSSKQESTAN